MDMPNDTPFTFSEIPPSRRQSSARSFVTASRIGDRTSSGVSTASITTPKTPSMGHLSTSPSSTTRNQSFHQTFIENWIYKTSSQQEPLEDSHNEQDSDTSCTDLPPWASPNRPTTSWHKPTKSFTLLEVNEEEESDNGNIGRGRASFLSDDHLDDEENEQESIEYPLAINEYSVMATSPTNLMPLLDDGFNENDQDEETTAEYKTASTTLRSPDIIHREIDLEYERELNELCKPHPAPSFHGNSLGDSQDTIPYGEDELDEGDTQPYDPEDEDTQSHNSYGEDTQPYNPDTPLLGDQQEAPDSLPEIPYDVPKDVFPFLPEFDDSDYVSPLASLNGDNEAGNCSAAFDTSSPVLLPFDENEQTEDELFDDITESDILQCEQEVAFKIKHTSRGKRKAESPIPVALESQIVRLDKKQIRTSVVKKPTTIDDYFLHPSTINSQTEQDIGKESSTPSFTISSNEDMNKSQEPKRRPRFGLSKSRHTTN
ncbi:SET domain-containing protein [Mucor velutinosus]|uniref:SET domain-containing protein n=1 Tax=Mucor velutinosus TaxID=708070 RepID=A0AAN7DI63_9FUNG|nr:SET domain-containing protein [Mucor velutinosus]